MTAATDDRERAELPAAIAHAGDGLAGITNRVQEVHRGIAGRTFAPAPVRLLHDAIAGTVYTSVRLAFRSATKAAAGVVRTAGGGPPLSTGTRGSMAQSMLCGLIGDRLALEHSPLAVEMAIRSEHRDVPLIPSALAEAFGQATGHPVLLIHGLGEQEDAWRLSATRHGGTYAERAILPAGGSPVILRYNTGLTLAENGRRLSRLLERLVEHWPVQVERVSLIGHSMGGLIARSAVAHGRADGKPWVDRLHTVVSLGSPHGGAPLARVTAAAAFGLDLLPEGRAVASVLHTRSSGIRDLERGTFAIPGTGRATASPATHHAVAATVSRHPRHPLGRVLGDLLVLHDSAHGMRRGAAIEDFVADELLHIGGANHFTLLNTPRLDEPLRRWLSIPVRPALPAAT